MKKSFAILALAALVMLAGCKKNEETQGTTLKASIQQPEGDGSRTSLNPADGAIAWTMGNTIAVSNGTETKPFSLTAIENGKGIFEYAGAFTFGESNVAVYPSETATIEGNAVILTMSAEQTLDAPGSFANDANPMLATFTDPDDFMFTSLCGVLGLQLTGDNIDITAIQIVSKAEEKLNGEFSCTTANPTLEPTAGNTGTNSIMLNCATQLTEDVKSFYVVLPVGTLSSGFSLYLYNGGEEPIYETNTGTDLTMAPNTYKTMNPLNVTLEEPQSFPVGAINGLFTVNANGGKVYFAQGNLQYTISTGVWSFMEHQYDMVEQEGQNVGANYANQDVVSLFGWGTSGYNHGATCYLPYSTSTSNAQYNPYGATNTHLYDRTGQADWGYNAISNGGNQEGMWRTLTEAESVYVLNNRTTASGIRFVKAKVNGVRGVILLPDDWDASYYTLHNINNAGAKYNTNSVDNISATDWANSLEAHGAVFMPAAGMRDDGFTIYDIDDGYGYYWLSSCNNATKAYYFYMRNAGLAPNNAYTRYCGFAVRLVTDAPAD